MKLRLTAAICLFLTTVSILYSQTPVAIVNPSFENGILAQTPDDWTVLEGDMYLTDGSIPNVGPAVPDDGARYVTATWQATSATMSPFPDAQTMSSYQDVDLSSFSSLIDAGDQQLTLTFAYNDGDPGDYATVQLDFYDGGASLINGFSAAFSSLNFPSGGWTTESLAPAVPVSARSVRITLAGLRNAAVGSARNVAFDDLSASLDIFTPPPIGNLVNGSLIQFDPNGGWSWFQDERAIVDTNRGEILVGSIASADGLGGGAVSADVHVSHFNVATRSIAQFVTLGNVPSYSGGDDHNVPGFVKKQDGNILAFYAGHNNLGGVEDDRSYYRTFDVNTQTWGPVNEWHWWPQLPPNSPGNPQGATYSNVFQLSAIDPDMDGNGRLFNVARVYQSPQIMYSDDNGGTWTYGGHLTDAGSGGTGYVFGYYKYWSNGIDRIELLATESHPRDFNTSIFHAYVQGDQMFDSPGNVIDSDIYGEALNYVDANVASTDNFTTVFLADGVNYSRAWTSDIVSYPDGTVAALFKARNGPYTPDSTVGANDHRILYGRFDPGTQQWTSTEIARGGSYLFPVTGFANETDYTGLGALDPNDPDTIFISTEINPIDDMPTAQHEIYKGVTADNGLNWSWTAITANSTYDNHRPIVPAWDEDHTVVIWMRGVMTWAVGRDMPTVGVIIADGEYSGSVVYVDADAGNTTLSNGAALVTTTGPADGATDGLWHVRTGVGNGGTVYTADEEIGGEAVPTIKTTVNNLAANTYDVYVYYWVDAGTDWRVLGGLSETNLFVYRNRGSQGVETDAFDGGGVLVDEGGRQLYQAYVGRVDLGQGEALEVFIDDHTGTANSRVWYDGIGYAEINPSPPTGGMPSNASYWALY